MVLRRPVEPARLIGTWLMALDSAIVADSP
jgi:hypothetical protein